MLVITFGDVISALFWGAALVSAGIAYGIHKANQWHKAQVLQFNKERG